MSRAGFDYQSVRQLILSGKADAARAQLTRHLQRVPGDARAAAMMAAALKDLGQAAQSEFYVSRALDAAGKAAPSLLEVAATFADLGHTSGAMTGYARAGQAAPRDLNTRLAPLNYLFLSKRSVEGIEHARAALADLPDSPEIPLLLSFMLANLGRAEEGERVLADAVRRFPGNVALTTARAANANYLDSMPASAIAELHRDYGGLLDRLRPRQPVAFANPRDADKRLRVAYISADLRTHSISYFLEAVLRHSDRARVEAVCYSTSAAEDATTAKLRSLASGWKGVEGVKDADLAAMMRRDGIDIAVDLMGHCFRHSLGALHAGAAPVQCTWMGYPGTTGLANVDARIVDSLTDPAGAESLHTESLVRIDPCFLCYTPPTNAPAASPRPMDGPIVFGSFNNLAKIGPSSMRLWGEVLRAVPGSRLLVKNFSLLDPKVRAEVASRFAAAGVPDDRLDLIEPAPRIEDHLGVYARVDIALDTFPYNGTTTTCEALWMGVPVVVLEGPKPPVGGHAGRVGTSLLHAVGLPDLAAADPGSYVRTAAALAADRARLAALRSSLREQVRTSPLCDGPAFASRFEAALRALWRRWGSTGSARPTAD